MPEKPPSERDPNQILSAKEAVTELATLLETSANVIIAEIPELASFTYRVRVRHIFPNSVSYIIDGYGAYCRYFSYTIYPPFKGSELCEAHGYQITRNKPASQPDFFQDLK